MGLLNAAPAGAEHRQVLGQWNVFAATETCRTRGQQRLAWPLRPKGEEAAEHDTLPVGDDGQAGLLAEEAAEARRASATCCSATWRT
ncbi:MAG: hypothetical protein GVY16_10645 [Planctomycetes bacterium]|nr:hypothetical protein [Planctomycetota bacterium]